MLIKNQMNPKSQQHLIHVFQPIGPYKQTLPPLPNFCVLLLNCFQDDDVPCEDFAEGTRTSKPTRDDELPTSLVLQKSGDAFKTSKPQSRQSVSVRSKQKKHLRNQEGWRLQTFDADRGLQTETEAETGLSLSERLSGSLLLRRADIRGSGPADFETADQQKSFFCALDFLLKIKIVENVLLPLGKLSFAFNFLKVNFLLQK